LDTYTFHEGHLPPGSALDFEPSLFNTSEFISLQSATGWLSYYSVDTRSKNVVAAITFHIENDTARSPLKAPFGSLECSEQINPGMLFDFLQYVEDKLRHNRIATVYIRNPPRAYAPGLIALLETFLLNQGYIVSDAEVGAVIPVTGQSFGEIIRHSELLRRRQAHVAGMNFQKIPESDLESLFGFLATCHTTKGYQLSISLEDLKRTVDRFPGRYLLFGVMEGHNLIAGSVSIRVRKNIVYNFLVNHESSYNHLSPPVLLIDGIYKYCCEHKISMLDLGTSALQGKPNLSLLDFKLHVGGVSTSKLSFYKRIS
jgi:hypothetical protein